MLLDGSSRSILLFGCTTEKSFAQLVLDTFCGIHPPRPTHPALTEPLWELARRSWDEEPLLRPEAAEISRILRASSISHPFLWLPVQSLTLLMVGFAVG